MTATSVKARKRVAHGEEIRRHRYNKGLTLEQLATKVGLSKSQMSRLEAGRAFGRPPVLKKIADLFGVEVDEITVPDPRSDTG